MKKIMFNDRYGLTEAVLAGRKTMTRRIAEKNLVEDMDGELCWDGEFKKSKYKVGEVVAVAQSYEHVFDEMMRGDYEDDRYDAFKNHYFGSGEGWHNKMFVKAEYMPHQIRITNVRVERLQDISDEDCIREGIEEDSPYYWAPVNKSLPNWRKIVEGVSDMYPNDRDGKAYPHFWDSPRKAFAALIDKVSGNGTWEANPWVYVYEFELVK